MGCASSKRSRCRHCETPYSPVTRRSFSMNVHHPPIKKGDSYHVVALTSSTLGSIKLDQPQNRNYTTVGNIDEDIKWVDEVENDENWENHDLGINKNKKFELGMIEAKAWSKMIDEKITRVVPKTPIRTPPGEPEAINVKELMEGLEENSPLRPGEHLRSFSFHVSADSIPPLIDSPRPNRQENGLESPKNTWFDAQEKDNVSSNGNLISKNIASDFDPEVISAFRKALEELSPTNPFHLKPRDSVINKNGILEDQKENIVMAFEVTQDKLNGITCTNPKEEKKINGDFKEENKVDGYARVNGFVDKLITEDMKDNCWIPAENNGTVVENGHIHNANKRVVLYFTSLRGVRKTYEDCCYVRLILKGLGVRVDERDVSMHLGFKEELRELLGDGWFKVGLPKVFVGDECIGGAEEIRRMHEEGKLEKVVQGCEMLDDGGGNLVDVCEACGDIRFVPCETCSGSCKIYYECEEADEQEYEEDEYGFQRCPDCNENGLVRCPICCY